MAIKFRKTKNNIVFRRFIGFGLITIGIFIISTVIYLTLFPTIVSNNKTVQIYPKYNGQFNYPISINFPSINNELDVTSGKYQYGTWQVSEKSATYLDSSGVPGETGNVVIYGHNKQNIFSDLKELHLGDQVLIKTATGQTFTYLINSIQTVWPNRVEVLEQGPDKQLTLFTCTGIFDSKRLVVKGILI